MSSNRLHGRRYRLRQQVRSLADCTLSTASREAVRSQLPLSFQTASVTPPLCPCSVATARPPFTSHIFTSASLLHRINSAYHQLRGLFEAQSVLHDLVQLETLVATAPPPFTSHIFTSPSLLHS